VAYRSHAKELFDAGEDLAAFASDIARAARAVDEAMKPSKINYGAYADKQCHLHFHIVPKYVDGPSWGSTFEMIAAAEGAAERPRICGTDRADPREARQRFGLKTASPHTLARHSRAWATLLSMNAPVDTGAIGESRSKRSVKKSYVPLPAKRALRLRTMMEVS